MDHRLGRSVFRLLRDRFAPRSFCSSSVCGLCGFRPGGGRNGRLAVVHACALLRIGARGLRMLSLSSQGRNMPLVCRRLLHWGWTPFYTAFSAVVADAVVVDDHDFFVVDVVNVYDIYVGDGTIVEEV